MLIGRTPVRVGALLAAVTMAFAACSSGGDKPSGTADGKEEVVGEDAEVSRSEPGRLKVEVDGDVEFSFDEEVDLRIVVIRHPRVTVVRFLSVGIEQFEDLPDGSAFRIAFDLAGVYDGAGEYELPAAGQSEGPSITVEGEDTSTGAVQGISKPFVHVSSGGNPTEDPTLAGAIRTFENALVKCSLDVKSDDAGEGVLECPRITDTEGQGRISLRMEWSTA